MKLLKILSLFLSVIPLTNAYAHFVEPECGIIENPNYSYTNYSDFSGMGYTLYHNGVIISQQYGTEAGRGYNAVLLKFINDSTGYFVYKSKFHSITTSFIVNKIEGDKIKYLGTGYNIFSFYIVNEHLAYMLTAANTFSLVRCSDILPLKQLYSGYLDSNITITDSLIGLPLCPDFQELNVHIYTGNLKISFQPDDSTTSIIDNKITECEVFPNPADDYLCLKRADAMGSCIINIFNINGVLKKSVQTDIDFTQTFYVGDLSAGVYIIEIYHEREKYYSKMVKK